MQALTLILMTLWTKTVTFGFTRLSSVRSPRYLRTIRSLSTTDTNQVLCGISFVQQSVVNVLNDNFDPKEVARANTLAKLDKNTKKKKKKKKKKKANDELQEPNDGEPELSDEEKEAIASAAAAEAGPFGLLDAMVTPATRPEFGDYQVNAAMGLAKAVGMNPR